MYNLLISLAAGLLVALAIRFGTTVGWVGSIVPGVLTAAVAYVALNLRAQKRLSADVEAALPHLERAAAAQWPARVMLGIARWRKNDVPGMQKVFEDTLKVRGNKKQGLVWCSYAWLLEHKDKHEDAVRVLARGVSANPSDDKLKS